MRKEPFMKTVLRVDSIAAAGTTRGTTSNLEDATSLTLTGRATYHADAAVGVTVRVYYSPDGRNYDTVPYTEFVIDLTAGSTIQETHLLDVPKKGYFTYAVYNGEQSEAVTNVELWATIGFDELAIRDSRSLLGAELSPQGD